MDGKNGGDGHCEFEIGDVQNEIKLTWWGKCD